MDAMAWLLIQTSRWVRRRPSKAFLIAAGSAVALSAILVAVEATVGWPDWATRERGPSTIIYRQ